MSDLLRSREYNSSTDSDSNKTTNSNRRNNAGDPVIIVNVVDEWGNSHHASLDVTVRHPT